MTWVGSTCKIGVEVVDAKLSLLRSLALHTEARWMAPAARGCRLHAMCAGMAGAVLQARAGRLQQRRLLQLMAQSQTDVPVMLKWMQYLSIGHHLYLHVADWDLVVGSHGVNRIKEVVWREQCDSQ